MPKVKLPLLPLEAGPNADHDGTRGDGLSRKKKKRGRAGGIFNHFNLTMDKHTAKYMP
jgi:hypothetical protein